MKLAVRPLTPKRWPDLEAVFMARGCSVARWCWCMAYRQSRALSDRSTRVRTAARNRAALRSLARRDPPPGLIGYLGRKPVGWISLGPREDYATLERSHIMKPVDGERVWSIVCFVVPTEYRKQGVAKALLAGAVDFARRRGVRLLEAYPVDRKGPLADTSLWFGAKRMYDVAGFQEIARRKPTRPVVRLRLA